MTGKRGHRLLALIPGGAAALLMFVHAEKLSSFEEGSGALTGPMIKWAMIGSAMLLGGTVIQLWAGRAGFLVSLVGLVLALPFYSWMFSAGLWCAVTPCLGEYPLFRFHLLSAATLTLAATSLVLQWRSRRS